MTEQCLWEIVAGERNGILATVGEDGLPQLLEYLLPLGFLDVVCPVLDHD